MDARLQRRYVQLVEGHVTSAQALAAGIRSLPGTGTTFAATQAAWRFWRNDRVTLPLLAEPLRELGRTRANASSSSHVLVIHDWSKLDYASHKSKHDLRQISQALDIGYEMASALLVDAATGQPLAPMHVAVTAADGVHSTASAKPQPVEPHRDQLRPVMEASREWGLTKTPVHVVDREGDSVHHLRNWAAGGHLFLVRADDRWVTYQGKKQKIQQVADSLAPRLLTAQPREVTMHGRRAWQVTGEADVVLTEPGWTKKTGRSKRIPGPPLPVRLIVSQVRNEAGTVLATWWLLTNATDVPADQIATWYYWRWQIESFHKLLKSAGLEIEEWGQENAEAITRRLLIGCLACVLVWQLRADNSPAARTCRSFLVRLSGRQMKRGVLDTAPALLAGLSIYLTMLETLSLYTVEELREFTHIIAPHRLPPESDKDV